MKRALFDSIKTDLDNKIILLTGPRQSGKTTLAKSLGNSYDYLNYDVAEDRLTLKEKSWDRNKSLVIFDELHKMAKWKTFLKGVYDKEGTKPNILVTGSAKLDTFKKVGDSLAGRYFQFRLHPIDLKEAYTFWRNDIPEILERLLECGGFPEPFLSGSRTYYQRWRRTHTDIILRQDLIDTQAVRDIKSIETLIELLKKRVGSTISYTNLARDLECDANTVKRWLNILEEMYIIFRVTPFHKNIARSLLKEPKYYFYDIGLIDPEDTGAKIENLVACSLLKQLHWLEDTTGINTALHFLRTKDGKELDFLVRAGKENTIIEVKLKDDNPTSAFAHFQQFIPNAKCIQLVLELKKEKTFEHGLEIRQLGSYLANL